MLSSGQSRHITAHIDLDADSGLMTVHGNTAHFERRGGALRVFGAMLESYGTYPGRVGLWSTLLIHHTLMLFFMLWGSQARTK